MSGKKKIIGLICLALFLGCAALTAGHRTEAKSAPEISRSSAALKKGESIKLQLRSLTSKQKKKVRWKSSKKAVATVTGNGKIKARKKGKAVIYATYKKKKYGCVIRVIDKNKEEYVTGGESSYREFKVDYVLHSKKNGNIHYNAYFPESYDGKKPYALFVTLPGYQGLYFQGVAENIKTEEFGFEARKYNSKMIVLAPQLSDWGKTSADQTIALVEYFISHYNIDASKVYIDGYSGGGETLSLVMEKCPELFAACLMCSSQWDGKYAPVVKARVPVYFVVGEEDEYYGSNPFREAYKTMYHLYQRQGLSEKEIGRLLVLDVKKEAYFSSQGVAYQHAGAGLFSGDKEIMGWLFGH